MFTLITPYILKYILSVEFEVYEYIILFLEYPRNGVMSPVHEKIFLQSAQKKSRLFHLLQVFTLISKIKLKTRKREWRPKQVQPHKLSTRSILAAII